MILWRPVGLHEMRLVFESGMRAFPPRLPQQPIFYPVLNAGYAEQIARDWNTKESSYAGYVLRFEIPDDYASTFAARTVGASSHRELWVPAEQLGELNGKLSGEIVGERAFFGPAFRGDVPERFGLAGKDAHEQIAALIATSAHTPAAFLAEIAANAPTIFLNYPFWKAAGASQLNVDPAALTTCLVRIRMTWNQAPRRGALIEDAATVG